MAAIHAALSITEPAKALQNRGRRVNYKCRGLVTSFAQSTRLHMNGPFDTCYLAIAL